MTAACADAEYSAPAPAPFFLHEHGKTALFCVWRAALSPQKTQRVWVLVPPLFEEEKSARRTLAELGRRLQARGESSLLLTPSAHGDSGATLLDRTLDIWCDDIRRACEEARRRAPAAKLHLFGVRLGATLCALSAAQTQPDALHLIEPIAAGRTLTRELSQRKKLRSMLTREEGGALEEGNAFTGDGRVLSDNDREEKAAAFDDIDGWPLSHALQSELNALDLLQIAALQTPTEIVQISGKSELSASMKKLAAHLNATSRAVVARPFWTQNEESHREELFAALLACDAEYPKSEYSGTSNVPPISCHSAPTDFTERAISFPNARGENLIGVWHEAEEHTKKPTIVMLHGWGGYRCGAHQMLTRAAQALSADGYHVLRFDFAGRGDSDGDVEAATLATMQHDTRAALAWCRENGSEKFVLLGTCAGCEVAFASAGEAGVVGLAMWGAPVFAALQSRQRDAKKRAHNLRQYGAKLLRGETYRKLFGGRLDYASIARAVQGKGAREDKNVARENEAGALTPQWRERAIADFQKSALPLLLIYGTADPVADEGEKWYRSVSPIAPHVHFVEGANHAFYGLDWERQVIEQTRKWLRQFD